MTEGWDSALHAAEAKLFGGLSQASIRLAFADWAMQLANQPARRSALAQLAYQDAVAFWRQSIGLPVETLAPDAGDHRFSYPGWQSGRSPWRSKAFCAPNAGGAA